MRRSEPDERRLDLLLEEIFRQRELMGRKVASVYTRGTVLVGAAGVLGGASVTVSSALDMAWIALIGLSLYAVAAIFGLLTILPMSGAEVDIEAMDEGSRSMNPFDLKQAILDSNIAAFNGYEETVKRRTTLVVIGFAALSLAWVVSAGANAIGILAPAAELPITVEIVGVP